MEVLDSNAMAELVNKVMQCGDPFSRVWALGCRVLPCLEHTCSTLLHCPPVLCPGGLVMGPQRSVVEELSAQLKECSGEFYKICPGFDRISRYCEFEPAIEAGNFKEQALLDRIAKLEAKVTELEPKK